MQTEPISKTSLRKMTLPMTDRPWMRPRTAGRYGDEGIGLWRRWAGIWACYRLARILGVKRTVAFGPCFRAALSAAFDAHKREQPRADAARGGEE